jgi:hypothetical protein
MKAANEHIKASTPKLTRQVHSAWVLIGLYAYQTDHRFPAGAPTAADDFGRVDLVHCFIQEVNGDLQICT